MKESFPTEYDLQPLLRLRQLAEEIRRAAKRNDMEVVRLAASLLSPTVERCKEVRDRLPESPGEAAEIAMQTQTVLAECEAVLMQAMRGIAVEMRRLQQGKRALKLARRRSLPTASSGSLGTLR